jgi:tetratricopeptide (TPR) repeat protein
LIAMPAHFSCVAALAGLWMLAAAAGCGSAATRGEDVRRASYAAFQDANTALQAKQYEAAEAAFTAAIDEGGLNFDVFCQAHVKRAVCRAAAGRYDEALAELKEVADHGGDLAAVESARSYVFRRQRNESAARAALARARRLDPLVEIFQD